MKNYKKVFLSAIFAMTLFCLFGANIPDIKALTSTEIQTQIDNLLKQITQLQQQLKQQTAVETETRINANCHTSSLWGWNYCSARCKCNSGEGDCDTNSQCNTGLCSFNVGVNYGQKSDMDVCENKVGTPSITVLSPNGGETWTKGKTYKITWNTQGISKITDIIIRTSENSVTLDPDFSLDNHIVTGGNIDPSSGSYSTALSSEFTFWKYSKVEIKGVSSDSNTIVSDWSDNSFNIGYTCGCADANGDGWVTALDSLAITNLVNATPTKTNRCTGGTAYDVKKDVNKDGCIDLTDSQCVITDLNTNGIRQTTCTTTTQPSITVTSPNSGEMWQIGDRKNITWTPSGNVLIYAVDSNNIAKYLNTLGGTSFTWIVGAGYGDNYVAKGSYRIKVVDNSSGATGYSNVFSVVTPPYHCEDLNHDYEIDGTEFNRIAAYWRAEGYHYDSAGLDGYAPGSGTHYGVPNCADYNQDWKIDNSEYLRVKTYYDTGCYIVDSTGYDGFANCTVQPSITVTSPNGGEQWKVGETHRVTWSSSGVNNVRIYIFDDSIYGSGSTNYITPNNNYIPSSQGYYDWTIQQNQLPGGSTLPRDYKIRVDDMDNGDNVTLRDSSDNYFSIVAATPTYTCGCADANGDGWVTALDSLAITNLVSATPTRSDRCAGGSKYDSKKDVNKDNCIDLTDSQCVITDIDTNGNRQTTCNTTVQTCVDSDGGMNQFTRGTVTGVSSDGIGYSHTDYCDYYYPSKVVEWYCDSNTPKEAAVYTCVNGCENGACKSNYPPIANAGSDLTVNENSNITLQGSATDSDAGDRVVSYDWSCSAGIFSVRNSAVTTYTAPSVSQDTTYTCTLIATDIMGLSGSDAVNILVKNAVYTCGCSDVNRDGWVTALDSLKIINLINATGESARCIGGSYYDSKIDVNGDGCIDETDVKCVTTDLSNNGVRETTCGISAFRNKNMEEIEKQLANISKIIAGLLEKIKEIGR